MTTPADKVWDVLHNVRVVLRVAKVEALDGGFQKTAREIVHAEWALDHVEQALKKEAEGE